MSSWSSLRAGGALAATFPSQADRLRAAADEAALSLGRQVARWTLEQSQNVHKPYPRSARAHR